MNIPKKSNGTPMMWSEEYIKQAIDLACGDDCSTSKEVLSILEKLWYYDNPPHQERYRIRGEK